MRYLFAFATAWFLAVIGASAMPYIKVLGVTPDLVLIFAACWAILREQSEAMVVVPVAGLLRDLTTSDPLGTSVLAMAPIVLLAAAVQMRSVDTQFLPTVIVVAAGSLLYGIISMLVLWLTGQEIGWGDGFFRVVLPAAVVNALFTPIVYLPVQWLSPRPKPGLLGRRGRLTSPL